MDRFLVFHVGVVGYSIFVNDSKSQDTCHHPSSTSTTAKSEGKNKKKVEKIFGVFFMPTRG
jgi:hypothetical protein